MASVSSASVRWAETSAEPSLMPRPDSRRQLSSMDSSESKPGERRQRRLVQRPQGGPGRSPRGGRRGRWLAEVAECRPADGGQCEHRRPAPQNLRSRDRSHGHRLDFDVGASPISVDLQEHGADAQGRALTMGDDDLDLFHAGQCHPMTAGLAPGLSPVAAR